jgi:transcriptional regulator with XRE-family HTH domain
MAHSEKFREDVLRSISGKSQRQIAAKMGVSQTTVSNMQYGRIPTDVGMVRRFAEAVGENPDEWELKAKLYSTEVALRAEHNLSEDSMRQILKIIEEEEEKHLKDKN